MCLWTSRSLVSKVGPSLIGYKRPFSTPIQVSSQNPVSDRSWKRMIWTQTKLQGTNLETKLLEVDRHKSRPKFVYPWLSKVRFKTGVFKHAWPPLHKLLMVQIWLYKLLWWLPSTRLRWDYLSLQSRVMCRWCLPQKALVENWSCRDLGPITLVFITLSLYTCVGTHWASSIHIKVWEAGKWSSASSDALPDIHRDRQRDSFFDTLWSFQVSQVWRSLAGNLSGMEP